MSIFINWPAANQSESGDTLYADIVNHCQNYSQYAFPGDKFTTAHETTHGVNSDVRMSGGMGVNGFYVGKNRAIVLTEPKSKKNDCIPFIPQSLRSGRYELYIEGQQEWNDSPLYIFDEFTAYTNGALTMIELKKTQNYQENVIIDGPVEFISYAVATLMAADKVGDLSDKVAGFGAWAVRHAYNSYFEGLKVFEPWADQDKLYNIQKTSSDWSAQRDFMKNRLNFEVPSAVVPEDDNAPSAEINWNV